MRVLFLSPAFPPNQYLFCTALAARGATVLAVGDSPAHDLRPELQAALTEYVFVPRLSDEELVYRSVAGLIARHGRIDRIETQIEIWLDLAARLRDDFNVSGPREATMRRHRSKSGMAEVFREAGLLHPPGERVRSLEQARAFAGQVGYPLVFKPDTGAGASRTFAVQDEAELERSFEIPLDEYLMQPFVRGDIVTFDGLVDRAGDEVFSLSHRYDTGIMQVVSGQLDGHYYSLREVDPRLAAFGRRAVAAFGLREHFFHLEVFEAPQGLVALEMNLRPPGGFTTDMMNYACDFDVYDLWARALLGERLGGLPYERKFHVGHAGRRRHHAYRLSHDDLVQELGDTLIWHRPLPRELAVMQGDDMYLLRHRELPALQRAIALVQTRA